MQQAETFVIADLHFGHRAQVGMRGFTSVDEMNMHVIEGWNAVVRSCDKVFVLGDVTLNRPQFAGNMRQLAGRKVLIAGNHDTLRLQEYHEFFEDIRGAVDYKGALLTHVPVHPQCIDRWRLNIHGHLHDGTVKRWRWFNDPRYLCVSAERVHYRPVSMASILSEKS